MSGEGRAPPAASPDARPAGEAPRVPAGGAAGDAGMPPGGDPSMDDILASIRRILNEDEAAPGLDGVAAAASARTPGPPEPPGVLPAEPFDLTEAMLVDAPPDALLAAPPAGNPPMPAPPADLHPSPAGGEAPAASPGLIGAAAAAAATASMGELVRAVSAERGMAVHRAAGPTIEDLVRDEMRPILRAWLDAHLPPLVERLVRAEIERVVGRALG